MKIHSYLLVVIASFFLTRQAFAITEEPALTYRFRDIKKPIIQDERIEKIIIFSAPRTGSTLMYMIFQYLFEDQLQSHKATSNKKVIKVHMLDEELENLLYDSKTYLVIPIRNPIDAFLSQIKISNDFTYENVINTINFTLFFHSIIKRKIEKKPKNILIFKYEKFHNNFSVIFNELDDRFQLKIEDAEKKRLSEIFSKDSSKQHYKDFPSFSKYDDVTGLHGNHISSDTRTIEEIFSKDLVKEIYRRLNPISIYFGYDNQ